MYATPPIAFSPRISSRRTGSPSSTRQKCCLTSPPIQSRSTMPWPSCEPAGDPRCGSDDCPTSPTTRRCKSPNRRTPPTPMPGRRRWMRQCPAATWGIWAAEARLPRPMCRNQAQALQRRSRTANLRIPLIDGAKHRVPGGYTGPIQFTAT